MNLEKLKKQLILHEGWKNKPYKCTAGKKTIGVGRNIDDNGLSDDEIDLLLNNDIGRCILELNVNLPWWSTKPEAAQHVLLDMCFNIGITRLLGFKKTLLLIYQNKYSDAASEILKSKWATQVGQRAINLSKMLNEIKQV